PASPAPSSSPNPSKPVRSHWPGRSQLNEATIERGPAPVEEIRLDQQDLHRILACLAHTAQHFDDEATHYQQDLAATMIGHPLGLLGGLVTAAIAELFADESYQLRRLHARLAQAVGLCPHTCPARSN